MSVRHPKATEWEDNLKRLFDRIDAELEAQYGDRYALHPNRPTRGETANPEDDGLFNVGAAFSAGFGSEQGRGYIVSLRMATLQHVPPEVQAAIEAEVVDRVRALLPEFFPGKDLRVERDGHAFKITGDLSL